MHHPISAEHAQHDLDLIAGHAAGDLTDTQRLRADALLQSCTSCADLRSDLVAIASASRTLPAPTAPRDFRLTAAQAARLRRGGWLKSILRPFAASRSTARPMAMAFTSLGLAGLLVATVLPSLFMFGSAGAAAPMAAERAAPAASTGAVPGPQSGAGNPGPTDAYLQFGPASQPTGGAVRGSSSGGKSSETASSVPDVAGGPYAQQASGRDNADGEHQIAQQNQRLEASAPEPSPIVIGSFILLALGLGLLGLQFVARRAI